VLKDPEAGQANHDDNYERPGVSGTSVTPNGAGSTPLCPLQAGMNVAAVGLQTECR
jgi:hypothetical protein